MRRLTHRYVCTGMKVAPRVELPDSKHELEH